MFSSFAKLIANSYEGDVVAPAVPASINHYVELENVPVKRKGRRASTSSTTLWDDSLSDTEDPNLRELVMLEKGPSSIADDPAHGTRRDG